MKQALLLSVAGVTEHWYKEDLAGWAEQQKQWEPTRFEAFNSLYADADIKQSPLFPGRYVCARDHEEEATKMNEFCRQTASQRARQKREEREEEERRWKELRRKNTSEESE
jgi:hypothetical protein